LTTVKDYTIFDIMKKKDIDISKLRAIANFAKDKGVSRQRIYELISLERFDVLEIDGVKFIILNKKAVNYRK